MDLKARKSKINPVIEIINPDTFDSKNAGTPVNSSATPIIPYIRENFSC
jgi:hypothetical protein